mmetsp:Transcript_96270/g.248977  ORF Transcript_96270/g.248977 Transcript_96270/m.248977 type:complete len:284 (+) Transcript_96270:57-908(+)
MRAQLSAATSSGSGASRISAALVSSSSSHIPSGSGTFLARSCAMRSLTCPRTWAKLSLEACSARGCSSAVPNAALNVAKASMNSSFFSALIMSSLSHVPTSASFAASNASQSGPDSISSSSLTTFFKTVLFWSRVCSPPRRASRSARHFSLKPGSCSYHLLSSPRRNVLFSVVAAISWSAFSHAAVDSATATERTSCRPSMPRARIADAASSVGFSTGTGSGGVASSAPSAGGAGAGGTYGGSGAIVYGSSMSSTGSTTVCSLTNSAMLLLTCCLSSQRFRAA